jgi:cation diffusion facilitator CzcD-associated flavoprotein CzcO
MRSLAFLRAEQEKVQAMLDWLIIGGGIHGTHLALVLTQRAGVDPERLRILDPHPSLLARWHTCTANTGMTFLRSGAVHHLDLHPEALARFAKEPAGQPYRRFIEPYRRPALDLFNAHSAHLIERYALHTLHLIGRACGLTRAEDGWRVETTDGSVETRQVALALGAAEQPHWPAWAQRGCIAGAPIQHIFAPGFCRADLSPWTHAVVVGGGISAAQTALALAQQQPGTVTLLTRHALRKHDLDSDPGWIGPKYQAGFQQITDYTQRRTTIQQARHRGSVPPNVAVQIRRAVKAETLRLVQAAVVDSHQADQGQIRLILADGAGTLTSDRVILATGFDPQRPGGAWLDAAVADQGLPVAPCGYPLVNSALCWADGLYVLGPLAELEIGPVARNITGARQAAERISQAGDTRRYRAIKGRKV